MKVSKDWLLNGDSRWKNVATCEYDYLGNGSTVKNQPGSRPVQSYPPSKMGQNGVRCIKFSFIALNALMTLISGFALYIGIWLHLFNVGYTRVFANYVFFSAAAFFIAFGVVGLLLCLIGCCGALTPSRASKCLLITYFVVVIILILAEAGLLIYSLVNRDTLLDNARYALKLGLRTEYLPHSSIASIWDWIQEIFGCCGVDAVTDWHYIAAWPELNIVPDSCCIPEARRMTGCGKTSNFALFYPRGCFPVVRDYVVRNIYIFALIAIIVAFVQLYGLVSSMVLACSSRKKMKEGAVVIVEEEPEVVEIIREGDLLRGKYQTKPYVETNL